ncbi:unnamed protein product [Ceratitis capitata]|uniref:(Mediterranean fruit fly) hypothetical protein n=1 Tax=Ceratitis capitata TaxID=7213 RepID=A0A811U9G8_CERCA|nr:unnamed protein product [Ceratitis capitata]
MKFAFFVIFCAVLIKAEAASVAKHTNKATTHTTFEEVNHSSSVVGYNYQRPTVPFNYPKFENTPKKFNTLEVETNLNLNDPLEDSKTHINVSKRLVGKSSHDAYAVCCFKIEKDLQTVVALRNQRRPAERRLIPYTEILTYA